MAQAAAVAKPPAPPRRRRASATPRRLPYLLIAPAALLMLGFIAYPVLSVFYHSLRNHNPTKPWRNGFAGLDNFTRAFAHDPQFWDTLTFSAQWVAVEVELQLLFGLALALIVNQTFVGRALGRALVFSPWAVSGVPTSAIWVLLYNSQTGITRYLADAGLGSYGTSWLSDTSTVFPAAIVADLRRGCRSSRSSSSPTSSRSPGPVLRPPRSTGRAGSSSSGTSPLPPPEGRHRAVHAAPRGLGVQQRRPAVRTH